MFTTMTWNVENLYRPGGDFGPRSPEAYNAKLAGLAEVITAATPDAIALQEIGEEAALDDLVERLPGTWHRGVSAHPDGRGIRVAWLSRAPLGSVRDIVAFPDPWPPVQVDDTGAQISSMGRGALVVSAKTSSGVSLELLTAHLKSKLLTFPGGRFQPHDENERARYAAYALDRRAAEAGTVRAWVTAALDGQGPARPLIVCGDLNDTAQAATTQVLLGPPGSEIGTPGFGHPDQGDAQRLWNLAPLMPAGQDYSRIYQGRRELIDHVLASAALVRTVNSVHALVPQPPPSVSNDPTTRRDTPVSDHAPVVAVFDV